MPAGESMTHHLFTGAALLGPTRLDHAEGRITGLSPMSPPAGPRRLVMPALANAHDHARRSMTSFGASGLPLESWILKGVLGTPPDPYLAAAVAFGRNAGAGCGAMMVHYTRPSGLMPIVDEVRQIAKAAADVGLRIAFALAVRDQNPLIYGDHAGLLDSLPGPARDAVEAMFIRQPAPPQAYLDTVEAIAEAVAGPMVDVQYGPAGMQWCSRPLIEAIAERSAATGRRVHMHCLETLYQRQWADEAFPGGMIRYLREVGLLSPRLTLAHCVHARPDELEMIAGSGTRIVTNFSSNLHLHSGFGPIAEAHRRGCAIAVGVDGQALDEDDDALREWRLVGLAHGGTGYARTWQREEFLALALRNGRAALGAPGPGTLEPGAPADFLTLDFDALDRDAVMAVNPVDLVFARANRSMVREVVVAGRTIVDENGPTGIDLPAMETELRRMFRANLPGYRPFLEAWPALESAVSRACAGCG